MVSRVVFNVLLQEFHSVTDLTADVPVGQPDDHPVLGRVVLVLVLHDQAFSGKEVRFTLCRINKNL